MDFNQLVTSLLKINKDLKEQSISAVNTALTLRNWFFGFYILEFEQNGIDRAEYGKSLLAKISKEMKDLRIPNTDERELRRNRQFYVAYPSAYKLLASNEQIRGLLPPEFKNNVPRSAIGPIRGLPNPELEVGDTHYVTLFKRVSYTHFIELIRIEDPLKRLFYELECIKGTWTVKELKRQIGSLLYERTGLSGDKEKLLGLTHQNAAIQNFPDLIRDPYVFEFLGLKPYEVLLEKEMEQALLDHLLQFLLELGKGFCFESRQKRIIIDNEHHYIDLVFYHRLLHCNILIDLKTERFNYAHAGQLNMYLEYYKKYEMADGDNPPIGILLCTDKDKEHVEFATAGIDDKVFVSQYLVALPDKHELEQFIKKEFNQNKPY
ncbi:cytoplasmic protein [Flavipsychrobacter stenotrophus]|uniref:Cytoplasmic protein n=1 Tax=Flavipsychrobacter stenotrophus TaxID=2077091 RepID=A0A2S7SUJ4_9BACT|nr:PDDEXK nuclease domain-containing protein [Flavipsychrobacter stenotrophus]PQJ10590.1 cytoplasmic protein [Flavipsychrobacter stenotrophus]